MEARTGTTRGLLSSTVRMRTTFSPSADASSSASARGFAVTRASPVTRIDDSVGASVSARAGTEPAAPTSSTATRHGVFPTQVERILIFYACCVRQFIVWTGGRACARPGAVYNWDGRRRNPCCPRPFRGYLGRGAAVPGEHGVGPHPRLESERGAMRAGHDAQVPERVREALERVLGARIGHVRVIEHSWYARAHGRAVATTRRGRIYLSGSATEFFANPWLMLHEYCHVIRQWEAGTLTLARYAGEWLRHGYWNNRFEVEARAFADSHVADLHTLLARTPTPPPARLS